LSRIFQPDDIARTLESVWSPRAPGVISGFSHDTRTLKAGDCFLAFRTEKADGHDFLKAALAKSAAAAIVEKVNPDIPLPQLPVRSVPAALAALASHHRKGLTLPVVGITGSYGKTSTKELLAHLLGREATFASPGNWNNRLGLPLSVLQIDPDHHRQAVLEAGINEPGEMKELGRVAAADHTVLTGIGPVHLEKLGSLEGIAREKAWLARTSRPGTPFYLHCSALRFEPVAGVDRPRRILIFDTDRRLSETRPKDSCFYCQTKQLDESPSGRIGLSLSESPEPGGALHFELPPMSRGMVENTALALLVAREMGVAGDSLAERLLHWQPADQRGQIFEAGKRIFWNDSYNANPHALLDSARSFVRRFPRFRRLWIIGGMEELGEEEESWHESTGRSLPLSAGDQVFLIGQGAEAYARGMRRGDDCPTTIEIDPDEGAVKSALDTFEGAVFLKGSRRYQLEKFLPEEVNDAD